MARFNQTTEVEVQKPQSVASPMGGIVGGNMGMLPADVAGKMTQVLGEMWLAKNFPRNMAMAQNNILNACASENLAKKGFYTYAKGGADVSGPSIRLAEAIAAAYGNISYGFEVISSNDKESKVRAYAFDKETNTSAERVFTIPHFIHTKSGDKALTDPREIYELEANYASRRIRACILEVIPINIVDFAVTACQNTLKAKVDITPDRIKQMIDKFKEYGITKQHIEAFIQRSVDSIQPAQFIRLIGIYESLQDKMGVPEDYFDMTIGKKAPEKNEENEKASVEEPTPTTEPSIEEAGFELGKDEEIQF